MPPATQADAVIAEIVRLVGVLNALLDDGLLGSDAPPSPSHGGQGMGGMGGMGDTPLTPRTRDRRKRQLSASSFGLRKMLSKDAYGAVSMDEAVEEWGAPTVRARGVDR